MLTRYTPVVAIVLIAGGLAACGGEDYSKALAEEGQPSSPIADPSDEDSDDNGDDGSGTNNTITPGTFDTDIVFADGSSEDALAWVSPTGEVVIGLTTADAIFANITTNSEGNVSGDGRNILLDSSWDSVSLIISGIATTGSSVSLQADGELANYYPASMTLSRDSISSDLELSRTTLAGIYAMDETGMPTTTININANGSLSGNDETGCIFNGSISVPDSEYNVLEISFSAENCGAASNASSDERNGNFSGLGSYEPSNNQIIFMATNNNVISFFIGVK